MAASPGLAHCLLRGSRVCPRTRAAARGPPTAGALSLAGHGDYAYQQSSYSEQSYERSFEDSTQHYYEGGKQPQEGPARLRASSAAPGPPVAPATRRATEPPGTFSQKLQVSRQVPGPACPVCWDVGELWLGTGAAGDKPCCPVQLSSVWPGSCSQSLPIQSHPAGTEAPRALLSQARSVWGGMGWSGGAQHFSRALLTRADTSWARRLQPRTEHRGRAACRVRRCVLGARSRDRKPCLSRLHDVNVPTLATSGTSLKVPWEENCMVRSWGVTGSTPCG